MNEAELTPEAKGAQIGWVQVGLKDGIANPAVVLPPLVQCFDDALRRFGALELSSLQVVAFDLEPGHGTLEDSVADRGTLARISSTLAPNRKWRRWSLLTRRCSAVIRWPTCSMWDTTGSQSQYLMEIKSTGRQICGVP